MGVSDGHFLACGGDNREPIRTTAADKKLVCAFVDTINRISSEECRSSMISEQVDTADVASEHVSAFVT